MNSASFTWFTACKWIVSLYWQNGKNLCVIIYLFELFDRDCMQSLWQDSMHAAWWLDLLFYCCSAGWWWVFKQQVRCDRGRWSIKLIMWRSNLSAGKLAHFNHSHGTTNQFISVQTHTLSSSLWLNINNPSSLYCRSIIYSKICTKVDFWL